MNAMPGPARAGGASVAAVALGSVPARDRRRARSIHLHVRVRATAEECLAALFLDGTEVERRSGFERVVDVRALGGRMVRALEIREPAALIYRWTTDGLPFVEERFDVTHVVSGTTDVSYAAHVDPSAPGEFGRSALLSFRVRRTARLRLDGLRALARAEETGAEAAALRDPVPG